MEEERIFRYVVLLVREGRFGVISDFVQDYLNQDCDEEEVRHAAGVIDLVWTRDSTRRIVAEGISVHYRIDPKGYYTDDHIWLGEEYNEEADYDIDYNILYWGQRGTMLRDVEGEEFASLDEAMERAQEEEDASMSSEQRAILLLNHFQH
jgi:hypothetical protein